MDHSGSQMQLPDDASTALPTIVYVHRELRSFLWGEGAVCRMGCRSHSLCVGCRACLLWDLKKSHGHAVYSLGVSIDYVAWSSLEHKSVTYRFVSTMRIAGDKSVRSLCPSRNSYPYLPTLTRV